MLHRCIPHAPAADHGHEVGIKKAGKHLVVDIHCHVGVPKAAEALAGVPVSDIASGPVDSNPLTIDINKKQNENLVPFLTDPEVRIADMDKQGVDIQAISPSPFHYAYGYPAEAGRENARIVNDRVAEIVGQHPDRFTGMGTLPLQNEEMSLAELDRCVNDLAFRGIEMSTNINGKDLTRAGIEKVFAKAEELGVVIFIHPIGTSFADRFTDHYFRNLIGHPLESALCVGHLIFDGYLDRYPGLKFVVAHGGGYVPAYSGRFDHPWHLRDDCRVNIKNPPSDYLKKFHFDTVVFTEHQLRYLIETWGADHVLLGTDYPFDMAETDPVGHVDMVEGLSDGDRAKVVGGNAARLLGLA